MALKKKIAEVNFITVMLLERFNSLFVEIEKV